MPKPHWSSQKNIRVISQSYKSWRQRKRHPSLKWSVLVLLAKVGTKDCRCKNPTSVQLWVATTPSGKWTPGSICWWTTTSVTVWSAQFSASPGENSFSITVDVTWQGIMLVTKKQFFQNIRNDFFFQIHHKSFGKVQIKPLNSIQNENIKSIL